MRKLTRITLRVICRYPFLPGLVLSALLAAAVLCTGIAVCDAAEPAGSAHTFLTGPAGPQQAAHAQFTRDGFDREMLAVATYKILKSDRSRQSYEEMRSTALFVIDAADKAGIDPFVALAVVFQESRFTSVKGDGGHACGIGQQHPRFSVFWPTAEDKSVKRECRRLMHPEYAAMVLAHHLGILQAQSSNLRDSVYRYNSPWDARGRYWWHEHFKWRCLIEQVYDQEIRKASLEAARAADIKGSYQWWRHRLASKRTPNVGTRVD